MNAYIGLKMFNMIISINRDNENEDDRGRVLRFYLCFYVFMYFALEYYSKIFFTKIYFLSYLLVLWIPQILSNYFTKNRISMPLNCLFSFSINRVFLPVIL